MDKDSHDTSSKYPARTEQDLTTKVLTVVARNGRGFREQPVRSINIVDAAHDRYGCRGNKKWPWPDVEQNHQDSDALNNRAQLSGLGGWKAFEPAEQKCRAQ